jgi:hypothetical protein
MTITITAREILFIDRTRVDGPRDPSSAANITIAA